MLKDKYNQKLKVGDRVLFAQDMKLLEGIIIRNNAWLDIKYIVPSPFKMGDEGEILEKFSQISPEHTIKMDIIIESMPELFI